MQTANPFVALIILFMVFIWYYFFFAPKKGSVIASAGGKDVRKWYFYIWSFGIFAMAYLLFSLNDIKRRDKHVLILLIIGYVMIFLGAVCIDTVFQLKIRL